jgi:hypothetical protein
MDMLSEAFPEPLPSGAAEETAGPGPVTTFPAWIQSLCPEVVDHMNSFPYFRHLVGDLPVLTSLHAAHMVCTMKMAVQVASSIGSPIYLHAGSHLGALLHGGPIPWDDDADLLLPYQRRQAFLKACKKLNETLPSLHSDIKGVKCFDMFLAVKAIIVTEDSVRTRYGWEWPFVDVFSFRVDSARRIVVELTPSGRKRRADRMVEDFRTHPHYFGGLHILGPLEAVALQRYDRDKCVLAPWTHRRESRTPDVSRVLDCKFLMRAFPFVSYASGEKLAVVVSNGPRDGDSGGDSRRTLPFAFPTMVNATFAQQTWGGDALSVATRRAWAKESGAALALDLNRQIPNLDVVEVENGIADPASCPLDTRAELPLRVVEFNAERGRHWLQAVPLLQELDADVIILNEMDIGMARSGQQHTTRLLAQALGMNYAWGLEFVELTRGNKQEQEATAGLENSMGLHGNAILTRCTIVDPLVVRGDDIAPYFSNQATFTNAYGYEKRLGGRMALLVRIHGSGEASHGAQARSGAAPGLTYSSSSGGAVVVGSTHTLAKGEAHAARIREYVGTAPAVIAGDQDWEFCGRVGLAHVDDPSHPTWPASCVSDGRMRGDVICSNMEVAEPEQTIRPCVEDAFGLRTTLSDHGITYVSLSLPHAPSETSPS